MAETVATVLNTAVHCFLVALKPPGSEPRVYRLMGQFLSPQTQTWVRPHSRTGTTCPGGASFKPMPCLLVVR